MAVGEMSMQMAFIFGYVCIMGWIHAPVPLPMLLPVPLPLSVWLSAPLKVVLLGAASALPPATHGRLLVEVLWWAEAEVAAARGALRASEDASATAPPPPPRGVRHAATSGAMVQPMKRQHAQQSRAVVKPKI